MQNGGGGDGSPGFRTLAVEGRGYKHADAHGPRVGDLDADFRGTNAGIENGQDVVDAAFENFAGVGIQVDVRDIADVDGVEIVFINIADDPDIGEIGDGKRVGAGEPLNARCAGDLLVGNYA